MTLEELKYRESRLRECFMDKLDMLDVDGSNDMCVVKTIKTYGALWHFVHQLVMAEESKPAESRNVTTADKMNIQASGLKMATR